MAHYRIYYLDKTRPSFAVEEIEAASDDEALARARALAGRVKVPLWELREKARLVHREDGP